MKRVAIITTHPIQYNAPLFRLLAERQRIGVKVYYTWGQSREQVYDAKFGMERNWDIPLLEGYDHEFVFNSSRHPDSNRFWGVVNPGLIKQLKKERYDAIIVYRWSLYSHLRILQVFGGNTLLFFRGDSHLQSKQKGLKVQLKQLLLRFVYRKVDKAFYVGKYNKDYFLRCGLAEKQLLYAAHAIDHNRFASDAVKWEERAFTERAYLGIPTEAVVFLYAGKFYGLKQLDLLIGSFMLLKGDAYRLILIGQGEQEKQLRELAKPDERIIFQSFRNQSEMPWVYRMGDVFVLPSASETWGLSVNEAMACRRPAIVSDVCGCAPELIVDGETGFLFDYRAQADLFHQLQKFTTKTVAKEMGRKAEMHVRNFSLERVAEVIEKAVHGE